MIRKPCQIMVVEDTQTHVALAEAVLERFGITPYIAGNYDEAIAIFNTTPIDLIFMDLQLPAKSGYEITYELRRLEQEKLKKPTPIIAVTAYMLGDAVDKCHKAGMDDCISKPLTPATCEKIFKTFLQEGAPVLRPAN